MRHTLKAVFDKQSDARQVLEELLASGYTHTEHVEDEESFGASVRHTIGRIFGHAGETGHGRHIVMFTTESEPEAERAASIIGRFGPATLEERHDQPDLPGAAASSSDYPPGARPGTLQYRDIGGGPYFGTQNAASPPMGNTFQHTMGPGTPWGQPEEEMAYRYGKNMGASDSYRDSSWEEAEPSLQSDWERKHAHSESSAWNRIKAAVRQGWERVKARQAR